MAARTDATLVPIRAIVAANCTISSNLTNNVSAGRIPRHRGGTVLGQREECRLD